MAGREGYHGRDYYKRDYVRDGKVTFSEYFAVEPDGVYKQYAATTIVAEPPLKQFVLPLKDGDTWEHESKVWTIPFNPQVKQSSVVKDRCSVRVEDVKVPAGAYTGAFVCEVHTIIGQSESVVTIWYVENIGPVKYVFRSANSTTTRELIKYTAGTGKNTK